MRYAIDNNKKNIKLVQYDNPSTLTKLGIPWSGCDGDSVNMTAGLKDISNIFRWYNKYEVSVQPGDYIIIQTLPDHTLYIGVTKSIVGKYDVYGKCDKWQLICESGGMLVLIDMVSGAVISIFERYRIGMYIHSKITDRELFKISGTRIDGSSLIAIDDENGNWWFMASGGSIFNLDTNMVSVIVPPALLDAMNAWWVESKKQIIATNTAGVK